MAYIFLILAAGCCTIAALWTPGLPAGPWYGRVHLGWAGMAFYLWSLVINLHPH
jgi:hypothetical protein